MKAKDLLVALFIGFIFSVLLRGQDLLPESPQAQGPELAWIQAWDGYLKAKQSGVDEEIKLAITNLKKLARGGVFSRSASILLVQQANEDMRRGRAADARTGFLAAIQIDPYLWPAYDGLAQLKKENDGNLKYYISMSMKGIRHAFDIGHTAFLSAFLFWFLAKLIFALKLLLVVLAAVLLARYFRPAYLSMVHMTEHRLPNEWWSQVVAILVFVAPFFMGLNLFFIAGLECVIIFPYLQSRERWSIGLVCFGLVLTTPFLWMMDNLNRAMGDPQVQMLWQTPSPSEAAFRLEQLQQRLKANRAEDFDYFSIGALLQNKGETDEALSLYERVPAGSPLWPLAKINTGNIYFNASEFQRAIDSYEVALKSNDSLAVAHYNLSLAYSRMGEHRRAESHLRSARSMHPVFLEASSVNETERTRVMPAEFGAATLLKFALLGFPEHNFGALKNPLFLAPGICALLFLLLCWLHMRSRNIRLLARSCDKCGRIFFISESPNSDWCGQCVNLYIRKDDLPSEAKMKKYDQVKAFTARKKRFNQLVKILLPGSRSLFKGSPIGALFTMFFWILLLVLCFSSFSEIRDPALMYMHDFQVLKLSIIAVTFLFWLIFGLRSLWQED